MKKLKEWLREIKKSVNLLYLAYKHKGTPWYAKVLIIIVVTYALSPIDLIPDFIPILGYLDDLLLIPLGVTASMKLIPKNVIDECRQDLEKMEEDPMMRKRGTVGAILIVAIWIMLILLILRNMGVL
jgi:uncharacterized membrane protein YkvA (DUF1232 family)